mmetsp:Transcript_172566/g.547902  ORF Transcript_172566/g.547902 Transcript_172566/m.547902 type:complete len:282 (-) Transcript_172566:32-877(-)
MSAGRRRRGSSARRTSGTSGSSGRGPSRSARRRRRASASKLWFGTRRRAASPTATASSPPPRRLRPPAAPRHPPPRGCARRAWSRRRGRHHWPAASLAAASPASLGSPSPVGGDGSPPSPGPTATPSAPTSVPTPTSAPSPAPMPGRQPGRPVGALTVRLLEARDLPAQAMLLATDAFAEVCVGAQRFGSPRLPGCNPVWGCSFKFDVFRIDTAMRIGIYRAGLGWGLLQDELLGRVEIPFLDLEDWSGCPIGRVIEPEDPESIPAGACMFLELQCTLEWL